MAVRAPKTLYHYCSLNTFHSIISHKSLWLSDISKSNDSAELKWLKEQCCISLKEAQIDIYKQGLNESIFPEGDVEAVFDNANHAAERFVTRNLVNSWAICFSERKDSLGQWRGYADDGRGISVGFRSSFLNHITDLNAGMKFEAFDFIKVGYSQRKLNSFFQDQCSLKNAVNCKDDKDVSNLFYNCIATTMDNAAYFKNPSFSEEKEWRIIFKWPLLAYNGIHLLDEANDHGEFFSPLKYDYCVRNNRLVSHLEIQIRDIRKAIQEIVIGPKCPISIFDLTTYLIDMGVLTGFQDKAILISKSESTYR